MTWNALWVNLAKEDSTDDFLPLEAGLQKAHRDGYPSEAIHLPLTRKDLRRLGKYLRKMLIVDPQQRATAAELAGDTSWI
jgi:hypothetical protein